MQNAYCGIFKNLGLDVVHVQADNGAMGGSASREFMVISNCGTDTIATCKCGFAANIETIGDTKKCKCGKPLEFHKAYELGHIFALGTHYSKKLNLTYTDENGKAQIMYMGCYGIGVERVIAAIVEKHNDERGIKWPPHIAPITTNIITINMDDKETVSASEKLYTEMLSRGESVIWDDRNMSAGIKLKDSDLLGFPNKIVISKKGVSEERR
jgi:prolyl-tRNA synthetase